MWMLTVGLVFIVQTLSFMNCSCNFICGLSDVIIKIFSQSVSQSLEWIPVQLLQHGCYAAVCGRLAVAAELLIARATENSKFQNFRELLRQILKCGRLIRRWVAQLPLLACRNYGCVTAMLQKLHWDSLQRRRACSRVLMLFLIRIRRGALL